MQLNPANWQLKTKFISIALLVLFIPISSVFLLKEIEKALVDSLKSNLMLSAKLYALQLGNNKQWFVESYLPENNVSSQSELFVFPLQQQVIIDGFFEEWQFVEKFRREYSHLKQPALSDKMQLLLGSVNKDLYLSIRVEDNQVIYPEMEQKLRSDKIVIHYFEKNKIPQKILITPKAPGKIPVNTDLNGEYRIDWRFTAYWVETSNGFNLEIKFPLSIKPTHLQVLYYDADLVNDQVNQTIVSSSSMGMNSLVWPSKKLIDFVSQVEIISGQRVWILDSQGRVLAQQGNLKSPALIEKNIFVNWLLTYLADEFNDSRGDRLRLNSPTIFEALRKKATSRIETRTNGDYSVAVAASPIVFNEQLLGAVLIEENVVRVQLLQKKALTQLLYVMLIIILIIMSIIGWYVSRLVNRITDLKNKVNTVVDEQGRMLTPIVFDELKGDEIVELNNAFSQMNNKLYEYNDYLEMLASRLSHELRTPIAIVRSSLDNLMLNEKNNTNIAIIQRALDGTQRLGEIISRMRQANSIKSAMQNAHFERLDINHFMAQIVAGFNSSFNDYSFQYNAAEKSVEHKVAPDLLAELLDKLLSNAMDFSEKNSPIIVSLMNTEKELTISVYNKGVLILKKNRQRIFQSLVSIRETYTPGAVNLGLGLYVVQLIADFHGAKVNVENSPQKDGVIFNVSWKK